MSDHQFIKKYLHDFIELLQPKDEIVEELIKVRNLLLEVSSNNKKVLIFGNGGSAAIASHFSVDLTKNAKLRCLNFNEASLITCFANDYGHKNWIKEAIKAYTQKNDILILISSSGNSKNIINAAKYCNENNIPLITFSGFDKNNDLAKLGDINIHINSSNYNYIEMSHHIILVSIVDIFKDNLI